MSIMLKVVGNDAQVFSDQLRWKCDKMDNNYSEQLDTNQSRKGLQGPIVWSVGPIRYCKSRSWKHRIRTKKLII